MNMNETQIIDTNTIRTKFRKAKALSHLLEDATWFGLHFRHILATDDEAREAITTLLRRIGANTPQYHPLTGRWIKTREEILNELNNG